MFSLPCSLEETACANVAVGCHAVSPVDCKRFQAVYVTSYVTVVRSLCYNTMTDFAVENRTTGQVVRSKERRMVFEGV
jgi:hypothetical protein